MTEEKNETMNLGDVPYEDSYFINEVPCDKDGNILEMPEHTHTVKNESTLSRYLLWEATKED